MHNPETSESLWKFPLDVMKGVVEYDRLEREKKTKIESGYERDENLDSSIETTSIAVAPSAAPEASLSANSPGLDYNGDEYEEVEVTDDEGQDTEPKRRKTEANANSEDQPVEFNEDDIAYQLAAMGEHYGLDPGEYGEDQDNLDEGTQGLQLTMEDAKALFFDLLDDYRIHPYSTWEKIMDEGHIIEDDRYVALPNMKTRKDVWGEWSRDRIQQNKERKEKEVKQDPSIPYMAFLQEHASLKLFWPEFKRKYRKEPPMRDTKLSDMDREKWYREYINRLKLPESKLKADLVDVLKSLPLQALHRSVTLETLPPLLLKDLRYISVRRSVRDPLIEAYIASLPPAAVDSEGANQEATDKQKQERQVRERALAGRQRQVNEEKRRIKSALHHSKGMLRQEEEEVQRALKVGKGGLLSHRAAVQQEL